MPPTARRVLDLARRDRIEATKLLAELSPEAQLALVCESPLARRAELLALAPNPEELVPRLPEAELCFTLKARGLADAAWLLGLATAEQVVACLDLDAWRGGEPDAASLDAWLSALADTDPGAILRSLRALDPELLVHFAKSRIAVVMKPSDAEGWDPPPGAHTLEGQFFFTPLREGDDLAPLRAMLQVLFERDYWSYFRTMQAVIWELDTENLEWARSWRSGRLEDLGFPSWDDAMRIYATLPPGAWGELPASADPLAANAWHLPIWLPQLPGPSEGGPSLFRAAAELDPEERRACFYAFVALANRVAVADDLPLGDAESTPRAIEKTAIVTSRGLEFVAERNAIPAVEALRRVSLERLFRVGANLDPEAARRPA